MNRIFKISLLFFLLLSATESIGQWRLVMEVLVTDEGKKLSGSEVKVFKNGSLVETVTTDVKGRADIPMDPNGEYSIEIGGNKGFIKKKIAVSTKNVPPEAIKGDVFYPAEVELFTKIDGLNLGILNKPIGKIFYDDQYGDFGADREYTKEVQKELTALKEDYLKEKEKEEANQKEKQKQYDDAIKFADKAFAAEEWESAEAAYKQAQDLMPIETYPSFQLAELETKLIKIRETNKKYDEAIAKADAAYASSDYEIAVAEFKKASGYKPDESYPQEKLSEVQGLLANQAKAEQTYLSAIEKGDNALKVNDLNSAKEAFQEAAAAKPTETYPKNKLAEINDILGKKEAKEAEYQAAIKSGDEALAAKDYTTAKASYEKASGVKPLETYPSEQIEKVNGLLAEAAKREQNYIAAIEKADNALAANTFAEAKTAYNDASKIKPDEEYPKNKIKEIDDLIAKNEAKNKEYETKITTADKAFDSKEYEVAKTAYAEAAQLKPKETYPTEKISEIEGILTKQAALEQNYKASILRGDQALENERFDEAKGAYNEAIALKPDEEYPKEKLSEIETIVLKNQKEEEEYNTAISKGDEALAAKDYEKSKEFFIEALAIKSEESYPKDKIAEIEKTIAAAAEIEKTYQLAIQEADAALKANDLAKAKATYTNAASIKPEEEYPKAQLELVIGQLAASEKMEADYKAAIAKGDEANEAGDYADAKKFYEEAIAIKTGESYPKTKITELESLIAANAKKEADYKAAIDAGDKALKGEDLETAKLNFQAALEIKDNPYPKEQITAIELKLKEIADKEAEQAKLEANYLAILTEADKALEANNLEAALLSFTKASELKTEETYPREKITEIKALQEKQAAAKAEEERLAALEKEYKDLIAKADKSFNAKNLEDARKNFQAALALKGDESYPKEKIEEINAKLADSEKQDQLYTEAISRADQLFANKDLQGAKTKYNEALSIKSAEQYPKDKIAEIDVELAAIAAKQEEIRLKQERAAEKDSQYAAIISEADELLASKNFLEAKSKYEAALAVKEDAYPVKKIEEIEVAILAKANQAEQLAKEKEQAKVEAQFQALISEGDGLFDAKKYQEAKTKFEEALAVKEDQYPRDKLSEIDAAIALLAEKEANAKKQKENAKKEAEYIGLITDADALFEEQRYEKAKGKYEEALAIKEDSYPSNQLAEIERRLKELAERDAKAAKEAEVEEKYRAAIQQADIAFANDQFEDALDYYKEAKELKPNEDYPQNKISQLRDIINNSQLSQAAQKAIIESKYMESITLADIAMIEQEYVDAKEYFKNAKALKPNETYPQKKLDELEALMNKKEEKVDEDALQKEREAKNEAAYQSAIATADNLFIDKKYGEAENEYELALGLKPSESYPKDKIDEIARILKEQEKAKQLAAAAKEKANSLEEEYLALISSADQAMEGKSYRIAKKNYQEALSLKANESYPKKRIEEINKLLEAEQLALEQKKKEAEKPIIIKKGPKSTINGDAEAEIERKYKELWAQKNANKNALIAEKEAAVKEVSDANREQELKKRENAIQRIENISISIREQESVSKELNLQNYEKLKVKTEDLTEEENNLKRNSERSRNNEYADVQDQETEIQTFQRERSEDLMDGRKQEVEDEYESLLATAKKDSKEQAERTKEAEEDYVLKDEEIRAYQKERSDDLVEGSKEEVENEYSSLLATAQKDQKEQSERTKKAEEDYLLKDEEIRSFNQTLASENLNKNTEQINAVEENWKTTTENYKKESTERTSSEQQRVNQKQIDILQFQKTNGEHYKDNQLAVEEKEKILKEEIQKLNSDSEERRQANSDTEYYEGEDLPRQDPEAADMPQGVSEEIIENPNNSTTIRRTVVNGTEVDIYEKTFFSWGGVYYTKNGSNITQDSWDANSR